MPADRVARLRALADALRWVRDHPEATAERGAAALERVLSGWTWERSAAVVRERMAALTVPAPASAMEKAKAWSPPGAQAPKRGGKRVGSKKSIELSLCMIVRDEEPRIEQCLKSIGPYVDEMVVLDTGSTDRTREIAQACGARVYTAAWTDSFAAARNITLELALGDRIFWMDADDSITPECGEGLRALIHEHPLDTAFQVQVRIPAGPREYSDTYVDHVKVFPNRPELRFQFRIHEQILPALRKAGIPVLFSELYVTHSHYDRSPEGQCKKRVRDFRLLELDLRENPDHAFVLFNLGMTHLYATRDYHVAEQYLRRCLSRSDPRDSIVRKAFALLTTACSGRNDVRAALTANEQGRRHYPEDPELLFQAGQLFRRTNRLRESREALERLIHGKDEAHYRSVDTGFRTYRGHHELALLLGQAGAVPEALRVMRQILLQHPEYLPARLDLADTLASLGHKEEAQRLLGEAGVPPPPP